MPVVPPYRGQAETNRLSPSGGLADLVARAMSYALVNVKWPIGCGVM
jgi:hypothetical protein